MSPFSLLADMGYVAALLTFVAFFMKDTIRLRQVALASNVAYALWAFGIHLWPTLLLHLALFPVNIVRLVQLLRERSLIEAAIAAADISPAWLTAFMTRRRVRGGTTLFHRGDPADRMYFVASGCVRIPELGIDLPPGVLIGEIGLFSPDNARTQSALVMDDALIYELRRDEALSLFRRDPAFGIFIVRLITRRLVANQQVAPGSPEPVTPAAAPAPEEPPPAAAS
ncbi:MAG: cyclic nucleotide-binding domain-containing protein [Candidatus Eremiobacteraeota bacterium]|nr:cyclic nucleotide-binding domain-containing protein [Candidatus Eremiobacteraeota bacterium]